MHLPIRMKLTPWTDMDMEGSRHITELLAQLVLIVEVALDGTADILDIGQLALGVVPVVVIAHARMADAAQFVDRVVGLAVAASDSAASFRVNNPGSLKE